MAAVTGRKMGGVESIAAAAIGRRRGRDDQAAIGRPAGRLDGPGRGKAGRVAGAAVSDKATRRPAIGPARCPAVISR